MTARASKGLTDDEVAIYRDEGLVVPAYRLPGATLSGLRAALDSVIAANPGVPSQRLINAHVPHGKEVKGDEAFLDIARDEEVLDLVERVIGPDIILWATHIFAKSGSDSREVPWHQDGHYWPIRPLATCSVWIALDDATRENGAMGYIPGSHRAGLYSHHTDWDKELALNQVLDSGQMDASKAKDVILEAGQLSLHDVRLIHGSPANRSGKRRAGLVLRYMPATSLFDRSIVQRDIVAKFAVMPIFLVRGLDRHGGNDFKIGH